MASALAIITAAVEFLYLGQKVMNIYHIVNTNSNSDSNLMDDITAVLDEGMSGIEGFLSGGLGPVAIHFVNETANTIMGDRTFLDFAGGTVASASSEPPGVAALVTQSTDQRGTRGRKFIPGIADTAIETGLIGTAFAAAMLVFGDLISSPFPGDLCDGDFAWGVIDKTGIFRPFNGFSTTNVPAYQRRRKQGVGA